MVSLMMSLLTSKANFTDTYKRTVSNWSSEEFWRVESNIYIYIYAIKELCSLNWIKSVTQEVMNVVSVEAPQWHMGFVISLKFCLNLCSFK